MKNPFRFIFSYFCTPTAARIAQRDLAEHQRQLLKHEEAAEYHTQMVAFHTQATARLGSFLSPCQTEIKEIKPVKVRRAPKRVPVAPEGSWA